MTTIKLPRGNFDALAIAAGKVPGWTFERKFGSNSAVGTSFEALWDGGGLYPWPTTTETLGIQSSDAADASAGAGMGS